MGVGATITQADDAWREKDDSACSLHPMWVKMIAHNMLSSPSRRHTERNVTPTATTLGVCSLKTVHMCHLIGHMCYPYLSIPFLRPFGPLAPSHPASLPPSLPACLSACLLLMVQGKPTGTAVHIVVDGWLGGLKTSSVWRPCVRNVEWVLYSRWQYKHQLNLLTSKLPIQRND